MTLNMTIIGLGEIGASFGLALNEHKTHLRRVGYDKNYQTARQAGKFGTVDQVETNLNKAVRDSEIVLICLPTDQIIETLGMVVPFLKEGAVVMETGLAKQAVTDWARQNLPSGRFYIGLTPILNPAHLHTLDYGMEASRADLYKDGLIVIVAPSQIDTGAVKLAADLTHLVGAKPLFADPTEVDGFISATYLLPQLTAAALVNAVSDQPGWRDARKLAGKAFAMFSEPVAQPGDAAALRSAANLNRESVIRLIDSLSSEINEIRESLEKGEEKILEERLEKARQVRINWWHERKTGTIYGDYTASIEIPEFPSILSRLFGIGKKTQKKS